MTLKQLLAPGSAAALLLVACTNQAQAQAAIVPFNDYSSIYGGTTQAHTWGPFTAENRPAGTGAFFATAGQWRAGITSASGAVFGPSIEADDADVTHFSDAASGGGIYVFGGTSFSASSSSPISNLNTLFVEIGSSKSGNTIEGLVILFDHAGGVGTLEIPTYTLSYSLELGSDNPEAPAGVTAGMFGYQFDLSGYNNITSYSVFWDAAAHTNLYGLQITESSETFADIALIPEPSTYALLAMSGIGAIIAMRRRRTTSASA